MFERAREPQDPPFCPVVTWRAELHLVTVTGRCFLTSRSPIPPHFGCTCGCLWYLSQTSMWAGLEKKPLLPWLVVLVVNQSHSEKPVLSFWIEFCLPELNSSCWFWPVPSFARLKKPSIYSSWRCLHNLFAPCLHLFFDQLPWVNCLHVIRLFLFPDLQSCCSKAL